MDNEDLTLEQRTERIDAIMKREQRRWAVRRWMVIFAFIDLILLVTFLVIGAPLVMDSDQLASINENESIIKFILGCLTTLIMGYFGLSSIDDVKSKAMQTIKTLVK